MKNSLRGEEKTLKRPVGIDLFAGAGGLSLAFEQAGFDVRAAVEIDPVHCAVHEFNFPRCTSICADATTLSGAEIRRASNLTDERVSVVFGGAPCQGFSLIGKRALDDPRNRLLLEFLRLAVELEADYFVFENVKGITIGKHKLLLAELIDAFEQNGYKVVTQYRVLNAADYSVPQDRRRLFLLGARKGLDLPAYPPPTVERTRVWEAIGDLPEASMHPSLLEDDCLADAAFGEPSHYAKLMRGLVSDVSDYSYPRVWDRHRLTSSLRTQHTDLSQQRFAATGYGQIEPVSRFFKLDPNGICNTLRAGTGSDRGAFTSPRPIHPREPRCITVREAARLHSYPDWFRFHVTKWHGFRQIGNSVPPFLGRAVAAQIMKAIGEIPITPRVPVVLGHPSLLRMTVSEAARHYGVSEKVVGSRLRIADKAENNQFKLSLA